MKKPINKESKLEIGIIYFIYICVVIFNFLFWTLVFGLCLPIRLMSYLYHLVFTKPLCVTTYYPQGGHKYFANKYHSMIWRNFLESYCDCLKIS
jgi:hypothetical protein